MIKRLIYFVTLFSLVACWHVIDVDVPPHQSKLEVFSINAADSLLCFHISKSKGIAETGSYDFIKNAKVKIYEGEVLLEEIDGATEINDYYSCYVSSIVRPESESTYRVEVSAPGFDQVTAIDEVPIMVNIKMMEIDPKRIVVQDYQSYHPFTITFSDPPGEKNFYMVTAFFRVEYSRAGDGKVYIANFSGDLVSTDPQVHTYANPWSMYERVFTDVAFDGKQDVKLNFLSRIYFGSALDGYTIHSVKFSLELNSISEALYKYKLSRRQQLETWGNPLAEPVWVFSNIKNGYGIFGLYTSDMMQVEVSMDDLKVK